jgi:hypothetical protein
MYRSVESLEQLDDRASKANLLLIEQSLEEAQNDVFSKEDKVNMSIIYIFMYVYLHVCSCINIWLYLLIFAVYRAEFGRGSE